MRLQAFLIILSAAALAGCANSGRILAPVSEPTTLADSPDALEPAAAQESAFLTVAFRPDEPAPFPPPAPRNAQWPDDPPPPPEEPVLPDEPPDVVPEDVPPPPETTSPRLTRPGLGDCDLPDPCCCVSGRYFGGSFELGPGIGGGGEIGIPIRRGPGEVWSLEVGGQHQDLWDELVGETQTGKFHQIRVGLRVLSDPCRPCHWTARVGVTWFQVTGTPAQIDIAGIQRADHYVGFYGGIGYEWDVGRRWSHGPEFRLYLGHGVNHGEFAVAPSFTYRANIRF